MNLLWISAVATSLALCFKNIQLSFLQSGFVCCIHVHIILLLNQKKKKTQPTTMKNINLLNLQLIPTSRSHAYPRIQWMIAVENCYFEP